MLIKAGLPVSILAVCFILSTFSSLALRVPELVGLTALLTLLSVFAAYAAEKGRVKWSPAFILLFAALLRIIFLFKNPSLSDDLFRYVFDGLMVLDGINPYAAPPLAANPLNPDAAALVPFINHGHLITIYPPAAQLIFAGGAFSGGLFGIKTVLILMDLAACGLILGILKRLGLPKTRLIWYAWHPLPLIEIGASAHIDGAAVFFILLTLSITLTNYSPDRISKGFGKPFIKCSDTGIAFLAGICFAGAVLVKWIPLLFFPGLIFLVPSRKRKFWFFGFALTCIVLVYPFWPHVKTSLTTLSVYLTNWEFAGFAFRLLRQITGSGAISRLILAVFGTLAVGIIYANVFLQASFKKPFLSLPHPGSSNPLGIIRACYAAAMVWLVMTSTLHPWYGLYLVFLLPFAGGCAGLVLSWSVFLAYRVLIGYHLTGQWVEDDWTPFLIVAAPVLAAIISGFRSAFLPLKY